MPSFGIRAVLINGAELAFAAGVLSASSADDLAGASK
jgi:hypothetical protein